eukprot:1162100-Pelagomonas_calceolata.AAC.4
MQAVSGPELHDGLRTQQRNAGCKQAKNPRTRTQQQDAGGGQQARVELLWLEHLIAAGMYQVVYQIPMLGLNMVSFALHLNVCKRQHISVDAEL